MTISINSGSAQAKNFPSSGSFSSFNVSAGDLILVFYISTNTSVTTPTLTTNAGFSFTPLAVKNAANFLAGQLLYCIAPSAKTGLVISIPAGTSNCWGCIAYNTTTGTWTYDSTTGPVYAEEDGGTSGSLPSITTPGAGVIAAFVGTYLTQVETLSTTTPFTNEAHLIGSATVNACMLFDSISQSSAQTATATVNDTAAQYFGIYGVSFYVSGGGGGGNTAPIYWTS
jgi:hypothetical protein